MESGRLHRGETQRPGSPREQVKMKSRTLKRHQEAPAPSSLPDRVTLSKSLGLTAWPCSPRKMSIVTLRREQQAPQEPFVNCKAQHKWEAVGLSCRRSCSVSRNRFQGLSLSRTRTPSIHISLLCALVPSTGQGSNTNTFIMHLLGVSHSGGVSHTYS